MAKQVKLKDQYYKLGDKAQSFVDPISKTKILLGQVVRVEGNLNRSGKLKSALAGGHILRADEDDFNEYQSNQKNLTNKNVNTPTKEKTDKFANDPQEVKTFRALSDAKKRKQIQDEYELEEADLKELSEAKGEEIVTIFKTLLEETEEEAEEEETDDEDSEEDEDKE